MNPTQPALVRAAIGKMPADVEIIIATDADAGGDKLAATIAALAKAECRTVTPAVLAMLKFLRAYIDAGLRLGVSGIRSLVCCYLAIIALL